MILVHWRENHYYQAVLIARCCLALSRHPSLLSIAPDKSPRLYPVFTQSRMQVFAGQPILAHPCECVHKRTSFRSSYLLNQLYPACLVRLTWMVGEIRGKWPYSHCLVRCCFWGLFKTAWRFLMLFCLRPECNLKIVQILNITDNPNKTKKKSVLFLALVFSRHELKDRKNNIFHRPWLGGWLVGFSAYQPFLDYLTPN